MELKYPVSIIICVIIILFIYYRKNYKNKYTNRKKSSKYAIYQEYKILSNKIKTI